MKKSTKKSLFTISTLLVVVAGAVLIAIYHQNDINSYKKGYSLTNMQQVSDPSARP